MILCILRRSLSFELLNYPVNSVWTSFYVWRSFVEIRGGIHGYKIKRVRKRLQNPESSRCFGIKTWMWTVQVGEELKRSVPCVGDGMGAVGMLLPWVISSFCCFATAHLWCQLCLSRTRSSLLVFLCKAPSNTKKMGREGKLWNIYNCHCCYVKLKSISRREE